VRAVRNSVLPIGAQSTWKPTRRASPDNSSQRRCDG
jgi:hypothetical protein